MILISLVFSPHFSHNILLCVTEYFVFPNSLLGSKVLEFSLSRIGCVKCRFIAHEWGEANAKGCRLQKHSYW